MTRCQNCGAVVLIAEVHHCTGLLSAFPPNPTHNQRVDFNRATELTPEVEAAVSDAFEYHPWDEAQIDRGRRVRLALEMAVLQLIKYVPPGPDRTVAIRKLREARMDANSAITHGGRY